MITFIYKDIKVVVDEKYLIEASYLWQMMEFKEDNIVIIEDIKYVEEDDFINYLLYLSMQDFDITYGFEQILTFDTGNKNFQDHPKEFWKIKLIEDLIRYNFYRLSLCKQNSYYGLTEFNEDIIPRGNLSYIYDIMDVIKGRAIIAGGSLLNPLIKGSDIDIFPVGIDEKEAERLVSDLMAYIHNNFTISEHATTFEWTNGVKVQIIHRLYTCISEVLHGFDIPICSIAYDGDKVYGTQGFIYSYDNRITHFDKDRISPSYFYRLAKWQSRGYKVELPLFRKENIDKLAFLSKITSVKHTFEDVIKTELYVKDFSYSNNGSIFQISTLDAQKFIKSCFDYNNKLNDELIDRYCKKVLSSFFITGGHKIATYGIEDNEGKIKIKKENRKKLSDALSQQNIIFMAILWNFYPDYTMANKDFIKDYDKTIKKHIFADETSYKNTKDEEMNDIIADNPMIINLYYKRIHSLVFSKFIPEGDEYKIFKALINNNNEYSKKVKEFYDTIKWMKHDPMKQLSGSFNPQKMEDLMKWYKDSGVYLDKPYKISIPIDKVIEMMGMNLRKN